MYHLVKPDSSPPGCWSHCCYSSSSSRRWDLPFPAPLPWLSASSGRPAWQLIGWECWEQELEEGCSQKRGCPHLQRRLGPGWVCWVQWGSGWSWEPQNQPLETSDWPGLVRMTVTRGFWDPLGSAALSSGSPLPSCGGFPEAPAASVSAAWVGLRLRWTEPKHQLQLWSLRTDNKKNVHTMIQIWYQQGTGDTALVSRQKVMRQKSVILQTLRFMFQNSEVMRTVKDKKTVPGRTWLSVLC